MKDKLDMRSQMTLQNQSAKKNKKKTRGIEIRGLLTFSLLYAARPPFQRSLSITAPVQLYTLWFFSLVARPIAFCLISDNVPIHVSVFCLSTMFIVSLSFWYHFSRDINMTIRQKYEM